MVTDGKHGLRSVHCRAGGAATRAIIPTQQKIHDADLVPSNPQPTSPWYAKQLGSPRRGSSSLCCHPPSASRFSCMSTLYPRNPEASNFKHSRTPSTPARIFKIHRRKHTLTTEIEIALNSQLPLSEPPTSLLAMRNSASPSTSTSSTCATTSSACTMWESLESAVTLNNSLSPGLHGTVALWASGDDRSLRSG